MDWSGLRFAVSHVLAIGLVLGGTPSAQAQLRPEPDAIKLAPRELIDRLRDSPTDYFRFVNRPWIARVCEVFAADLPNVPIVRLHGDAHIEQFAVTEDAWGLDDFDDSARGPALVDIVRFLGSVDIVLRRRDWSRSREAVFDRFFAGYRRGLAEPDSRTPQPAIVGRLRTQVPQSRAAFLEWGETQLQPMGEAREAFVADVFNHYDAGRKLQDERRARRLATGRSDSDFAPDDGRWSTQLADIALESGGWEWR
jgi:uncharacterized protein DUF2252